MMKSISQNSKVTKITLETREDTTKLYKKKEKDVPIKHENCENAWSQYVCRGRPNGTLPK
jgi:hypothetical protein